METKPAIQSTTIKGVGTTVVAILAGLFIQYAPFVQEWLLSVAPEYLAPHVPWLVTTIVGLAGSYAGVKGRVQADKPISGVFKKK